MSRRAVVIASLLLASPAVAFDTSRLGRTGTLVLEDLMPLIGETPSLKPEVVQAPAEVQKKEDAVICFGMRFPGQWEYLGGERISPYTCRFAEDKWLQIPAEVRITSRGGHLFERITPQAMKNAANVSETNPTWKWTARDPFAHR